MILPSELHRAVCDRCRRPASVCFCAHLVSLETRTRVLLLQHPRERRTPIGTARLAHLCLPGSELHVGVDFDDNPEVLAALAAAEAAGRPAHLLFPGPRSVDLAEAKLDGPITLVVVDGTWWQARKLVKRNARLAALPQLRFTPPAPSRYRIRREPAEDYVATVEALAHVLGALEGDPARFAGLLRPFDAMIDTQVRYATHVRGARKRHALHRARIAAPARKDRSCCASAPATWSACTARRTPGPRAGRAGIRPSSSTGWRAARAPARPSRRSSRRAGRWRRRSRATSASRASGWPTVRAGSRFARAGPRSRGQDDVVCSWGRFPLDLLESEGIALPPARVDVRPAVGVVFGTRAGAIEDCTTRLGIAAAEPFALGRAGTRLAALSAIVDKLLLA